MEVKVMHGERTFVKLLLDAGRGASMGDARMAAAPRTSKRQKEQFTAITQAFQKEQIEWQKLYLAAKDRRGTWKALLEKRPSMLPTADKMLELAQKHPKDAVVFDALAWVLNAAGSTKQSEKALELVTKNYLGDPKLVKILPVFCPQQFG